MFLGVVLLAGCASTSVEWIRKQEGYRLLGQGYVIEAIDIASPKVTVLKDGKAYEITTPGSTVLLEFGRGRRQRFTLEVGDVFVHGRPYSYILQRVGGPADERGGP